MLLANSTISRRTLLLALAALPLAGRAWAGEAKPLRIEQVAAGVFVHQAPYEEATPANLGGIANLGFVVGEQKVAVIDSGGSLAVGQGLLAAIRQVTDRPVAYVINTHFHPDHILGNGAFAGATFVGHRRMVDELAQRGPYYLETLKRDLGAAGAGSTIVPPTLLVDDQLNLDLGGRHLQVKAWTTAHTDCDVTIRDQQTDTWFLGDLLFVKRMPTIDGSLKGWIEVLQQLRAIPAARAVPGHGPASVPWPAAADSLSRYLAGLASEVRAALKKGATLEEATATVGRDLKDDWVLFDQIHPRNVTVAYAELEWD